MPTLLNTRLPLAMTLALTIVSACASSEAREVAPPQNFIGATGAGIGHAATSSSWWRLFDDPQLDQLVKQALAANTDLRVAFANLETARAASRQAQAARLPATVIESGAGPDRADRQPSTTTVPKTSYELGGTLAFEIDLFGRLRHAALAAKADARAVAAARDAVTVTVAADTAGAYLDLCAATANLTLARDLLNAQEKGLALVRQQLAAGEVSPLQISQAEVLRDQAAAAVSPFEADRNRALFQLATLQGLTPAQVAGQPPRCSAVPHIISPIPVGDGTQLLARRPDVREAEQRLAAADARIAVARAELYPRIQLGGSGGLIGGGSDAFLTPLISWVFPNQAPPRARLRGAKGAHAAMLASFDGTVLRALQEVETALSDYQAQARRRDALMAAAASAEAAARRAQTRQTLGADDFLVVLDAERTRNAALTNALAAKAAVARVQIQLFRALGGGWEELGSTGATDAGS